MAKRGARKATPKSSKPVARVQPVAGLSVWVWMVGLVLLVLLTFNRLFQADFTTWDDLQTLKQNPWFNPPTTAGLQAAWTTSFMDLWVPVTYTVWWGTAQVAWNVDPQTGQAGLSGGTFHILNVLLHAASACLVFLLLRRLKYTTLPAAVASALFALHPVQVEPVGWTSGTKDVLFGCLSLASLTLYFRAVDSGDDANRKPEPAFYLASAMVLLCAVMSKPTAIVVPALAFTLDWLVLGRAVKRAALSALPLLVLMVPFAVVGKLVQPVLEERGFVPVLYRPLVAADAVAFYFGKILVPFGLIPDYSRAPAKVLVSGALYWTWIVPVLAAGLVAWAWIVKKSRIPTAAFGAFLIGMGPVLGFVRFDFQNLSTVADHYLYLPMLGVALLVAWALSALPTRLRPAGLAGVGLIVVALAARSFDQSQHWQNARALWEHTLDVSPDSWAANNSLATLETNEGRLKEAIPLAEKAYKLRPFDANSKGALARVYSQIGRLAEAETLYRELLSEHPNDSLALSNMSGVLAQQGKLLEAIPFAERAVWLQPTNNEAQLNYGRMLWDTGRRESGFQHVAEAVRLQPNDPRGRARYGIMLEMLGRIPEAAEQFRAFDRLQPGHPLTTEFFQKHPGTRS